MSRYGAVSFICHTSVQDGLTTAALESDAVIRKAIAYEKSHGKRTALITGLERELRRRAKERKS